MEKALSSFLQSFHKKMLWFFFEKPKNRPPIFEFATPNKKIESQWRLY
jgi:hypothetical protein